MFKLLTNLIYFINATGTEVVKNDSTADLSKAETSGTVSPIYDFLDNFGPLLIGMLLGVGTLYCIILGVQYAKAEKGDERDVAKKKAINAGISFGVIIILVVVLYAMRETFVDLLSD